MLRCKSARLWSLFGPQKLILSAYIISSLQENICIQNGLVRSDHSKDRWFESTSCWVITWHSLPLSEKQGIQNIFLGIKSNNVSSSFGHSFEYIFLCLRSFVQHVTLTSSDNITDRQRVVFLAHPTQVSDTYRHGFYANFLKENGSLEDKVILHCIRFL